MTYPRNPSAPLTLASSAARDRTVDVLRAAFTEGRLTQDEFHERSGAALRARTHADLAVLIADVPVGPLPWQSMTLPTTAALQPVRSDDRRLTEDWRVRLTTTGALLLTCLGTIAVVLLALVIVVGAVLGGAPTQPGMPSP